MEKNGYINIEFISKQITQMFGVRAGRGWKKKGKGGERHTYPLSYSDKNLSEDHRLIKYLWILMHWSVKSGNIPSYQKVIVLKKDKEDSSWCWSTVEMGTEACWGKGRARIETSIPCMGRTDVSSPETAYPLPHPYPSRPTERYMEKREGVTMWGEILEAVIEKCLCALLNTRTQRISQLPHGYQSLPC